MNTALFYALCTVTLFAINTTPKQVSLYVQNIWKNLTDPYQSECIENSTINLIYSDIMLENAYVSNSLSFGCYLKCIYEKIGVLKPDGEFDFYGILNKMSYMTEEVTRRCIDEGKDETDVCLKSLIVCSCAVNAFSIDKVKN
ncbi:hypothetical protein FQR65_LT00479 [Abscondita terminalis]|nr:hypothetical protein FQR65_LT00479 [Abscondita terminalis]